MSAEIAIPSRLNYELEHSTTKPKARPAMREEDKVRKDVPSVMACFGPEIQKL